MQEKETPALQIESARKDLESQIRQVLRDYERNVQGPLEIDLTVENRASPDDAETSEQERALRNRIYDLVDAFHQRDIIRQTGVRIYKITAIDSDGDGVAALNVKYEYPVDPGISR